MPAEHHDPPGYSRRQFLARLGAASGVAAGATALGVALHRPGHFVPGLREAAPAAPRWPSYVVETAAAAPRFVVAHGANVEKMVRAAAAELGGQAGMARFIKPGDKVVIKPNVAFDRAPQLGATTHPDTIKAIARLVHEAGAAEIRILDNPISQPESCFAKTGVTQAVAELAKEMNVRLVLPSPLQFETIQAGGVAIQEWSAFFHPFKGVNKIIGVAPLKNHNLCHASMTMKNWYGLLGGRRNQFHQDIHNVIADLAHMIAPTLVFLDATRVLTRNGPTGGSLADVKPGNAIIAGTDQVAVDAYGCETFLGLELEKVKYLKLAHDRGIGRMDWRQALWREVKA